MKIAYSIIAVVIVLAFSIAGKFDYEEAQRQRAEYCEMVALWKTDAARGVPENDRIGWPPFNGECNHD